MADVEVTGTIANIGEKTTAKNKRFLKLELEETEDIYFVWKPEMAEDLGLRIGDKIKITHDGGEYPRVKSIVHLSGPEKQTQTTVAGKAQHGDKQVKDFKNGQFRTPDQIMRSTALECAVTSLEDLLSEGQNKLQYALVWAQTFYDYLKDGTVPETEPEEPAEETEEKPDEPKDTKC